MLNAESKLVKCIFELGKHSFEIYLIHTFVVWDMIVVIIKILQVLNIEISHSALYIVMLPIMYVLSYLLARLLGWYLNKLGVFKDYLKRKIF